MGGIPLLFAILVWGMAGICPDPPRRRLPRRGGGVGGSDPSDPWGPNPGPDDGPRPPGPWPWKLVGALAGIAVGWTAVSVVPGFAASPFTNLALSAGLAYVAGSFAMQVAGAVGGGVGERNPAVRTHVAG